MHVSKRECVFVIECVLKEKSMYSSGSDWKKKVRMYLQRDVCVLRELVYTNMRECVCAHTMVNMCACKGDKTYYMCSLFSKLNKKILLKVYTN